MPQPTTCTLFLCGQQVYFNMQGLDGNKLQERSSQVKKSIILMTLVIIAIFSTASVTQAAILKVGSTGSEISMLQTKLQTLNYDVGPIDGIYGSKTKTAVQGFQFDNHLLVDGIVGPQTQEALNNANISPQEKTKRIITTAKSFLGVPYQWGGTTQSRL